MLNDAIHLILYSQDRPPLVSNNNNKTKQWSITPVCLYLGGHHKRLCILPFVLWLQGKNCGSKCQLGIVNNLQAVNCPLGRQVPRMWGVPPSRSHTAIYQRMPTPLRQNPGSRDNTEGCWVHPGSTSFTALYSREKQERVRETEQSRWEAGPWGKTARLHTWFQSF